jgi:hypothetical protein
MLAGFKSESAAGLRRNSQFALPESLGVSIALVAAIERLCWAARIVGRRAIQTAERARIHTRRPARKTRNVVRRLLHARIEPASDARRVAFATVESSFSAFSAILALNAGSNFLRDFVNSFAPAA